MKAIVVYSSKTGRIQQIAQAMAQVLPQGTPCVPVDEMPSDFSNYDCVFMGFWIDENQADPKGQEALKKIANDHVAIFTTMYDDPYSDQASKHLRSAVELLKPGSGVVGTYITWTDKARYMHEPDADEDLHLDEAQSFAKNTVSRLKGN